MKISFHRDHDNLNKYLLIDLERRLGVSDLLFWMEEEAERLAYIGQIPQSYVEFTEPLLCERKIKAIYHKDTVSSAYIEPAYADYYNIYYNRMLPLFRKRFSIAHEIGHTYWFAPGGGAKPLSPIQRRLGSDPSIENLCNRFAVALLLPQNCLLNFVHQLLGENNSVEIPLHIIPAISSKFCVAEKAVARRIFFAMSTQLDAVICLRPLANKSESSNSQENQERGQWETSWYAFPNHISEQESVSGFSTPLSKPRRIPDNMVPDLSEGGTHILQLDGRWWSHGLKQLPEKESKKSFKTLPPESNREAYISKIGERIYIAFPSENSR
jgi:Zn-dependent peptidase ImmA (M78 family)